MRRDQQGNSIHELQRAALTLCGAFALLARAADAALPSAAPPAAAPVAAPGTVHGSLVVWGDVVVDFADADTDEQAAANPFLDRKLDVSFRHLASGEQVIVPGYYAADGDAADSGASSGGTWRAHLLPDLQGTWTYKAVFHAGPGIATSLDINAGSAIGFNGATGSFTVGPMPSSATGFHRDGLLRYVGGRYLRFAGSGRPFVKTGSNSPENLLAFADFDGTPPSHHYAPHVADFAADESTWQGGQGKGLLGAVDYLAAQGVDSAYFLTFNVGGDGKDVWPWTASSERLRFDVSKLEQWNLVFDEMDRRGVALHVVTQETENDNGSAGLDDGELGVERRLYYRELVARFAHHPALQWNLGEENSNTTGQQEEFIAHLRALDGYDHPITVHTFPTAKANVFNPLIAAGALEVASLQVVDIATAHAETLQWVAASAAGGKPWAVTVDEIGPPDSGVVPDANDPGHDAVRRLALWGNLMAGGAGCEWYFGYAFPNDDLDCEDFHARQAMWDQSRFAREFLEQHVPLEDTVPADALVTARDAAGAPLPVWCLALPGETYAVYLPQGGQATLDLGPATTLYEVRWYDPRAGGALAVGSVGSVTGPGLQDLGLAPHDPGQDWAVLVRRSAGLNAPPTITGLVASPSPFPGNVDFDVWVKVADSDEVPDVATVLVHFVAPGLIYVGAAEATKISPGLYKLHVP
ncbi:MAG TPA: DUF5060 domain-containing protein, partial [Planctomycetota bacterium]|nr:DUF5060 domain-containing protein [Planctomycetota bacterium]